jgi:hypothetical protein
LLFQREEGERKMKEEKKKSYNSILLFEGSKGSGMMVLLYLSFEKLSELEEFH